MIKRNSLRAICINVYSETSASCTLGTESFGESPRSLHDLASRAHYCQTQADTLEIFQSVQAPQRRQLESTECPIQSMNMDGRVCRIFQSKEPFHCANHGIFVVSLEIACEPFLATYLDKSQKATS